MKWYSIGGSTQTTDLFLLHDWDGKPNSEPEKLSWLQDIPTCSGCGKFDEWQLVKHGFDCNRIFNVQQDMLSYTNDSSFTLVTDRFRKACEKKEVGGVSFHCCGQSRNRGQMYVLWPEHFSLCLAPLSEWGRDQNYPPEVDEACETCGRVVRTYGLPYQSQLELPSPDEPIITSPSTQLETSDGRDFMFICSDTVRRKLKEHKLTGISFGNLRASERFYPPPAKWVD